MEKRTVPWLRLGGLYEEDDLEAVTEILNAQIRESAGFFRLPEEPNFERAFAEHEGAKYASAVNSCGSALDLCLTLLGIREGDEVITTPLTFVASASCVLTKGAKVVLADIDPESYCLDPEDVERKVTSRTKAVIPVHLAGLSADIDAFEKIREKYVVHIVYDAAHAVSAKYKGKKIGNAGDLSCYSFHSAKNMCTLGEGGAITTDNKEYHQKLQSLKSFGFVYGEKDEVVIPGFNYRMTKVQSAVGLTQLKKVDRVVRLRREKMRYLNVLLEEVEEIILPKPLSTDDGHACHLDMLRLDEGKVSFSRDEFLECLKKDYGVGATIHYPPIWEWRIFEERGYTGKDTPVAARVCRELFNPPVFPKTSEEDLSYIAWAIKEAISKLRKQHI